MENSYGEQPLVQALLLKSYHVSEFPNAAKNKIPDPMTKAAFFTESHRPPVLSCTQENTHKHEHDCIHPFPTKQHDNNVA